MPYLSDQSKRVGWSQFIQSMARYETRDITLIDQGVVADTYGKKVVWPGTVIAQITGSHLATYQQGIVKVTAPSYGPGSDAAWGLLIDVADLTKGSRVVSCLVAGTVREAYVTDEGTVGTVQAATKTALPHVIWV